MLPSPPEEGLERSLSYRPHHHQRQVHLSEAKFRVVVAGRQSGKTLTGVAEIASWVLEGEPKSQFWWVTASNKTKDKAWRDLLDHLPNDTIKKTNQTDLFIDFTNGSRISIRSAEAEGSLVGERLHGFVCDEFAQWKPGVIQILMPTIGTVKDARVLFIGTPRGRNWAYDLYMRGMQGDPQWASFHWSSIDSPYFSQEEFDRARRETPERFFRQEYLAEFIEGGGEVFRNIDNCVSVAAMPDHWNIMGLDVARVQDWTVAHVLNSKRETVETQRLQRMDWSLQKLRVVEMYRRNKCVRVVMDGTGVGDQVAEELRRAGLNVEVIKFTNENKANLIEYLMLLFEQSVIRIPNDPVLLEELKSYTFDTTLSGNTRYEAPSGRHDDHVIALALACWGTRYTPMVKSEKKSFIPKRMVS